MAGKTRPIGDNPKLTIHEAQDAMAACFGDLEKLAWRFFTISRDLDVRLEDEDFPHEKPGPDHLRFMTALANMGTYYEMLALIERARRDAVLTHSDLVYEWEKRHPAKGKRKPKTPRGTGGRRPAPRKPAEAEAKVN